MKREYGVYSPKFETQAILMVRDGKRLALEVTRDL